VSTPPRSISHSAGLEATALGHHWFGEEHVLLALLADGPDSHGVRALADLGLTHDAVTGALIAHVEQHGPPTPKEYDGALSDSSYHNASGRAEGLALGTGAPAPDIHHWLPAVLWDDGGTVVALLARLGVSRSEALTAVGDLAGLLPETEAPSRNPLVAPGERQALSREHGYIAEDDILLGLLVGEPDERIRSILESHGLTYERAAESIRHAEERSTPPSPRSPEATTATPNPACRQLLGRSEGLAVTLGDGTPGSTEGFIAYLWDRDGEAVVTLERLDVSAAAVVHDLAAAGVRLPAAGLPEPDRRSWGEPVFIPTDRVRDVIDLLVERLGPGRFGFNNHDGRAWVIALADIDLRALVDEALTQNEPSRRDTP
jgi:hypothetical protein